MEMHMLRLNKCGKLVKLKLHVIEYTIIGKLD